MKPGKPWQGRMIKIGLATLLTLTLAAALLLVPAPGFRLAAQSTRWTATDHERTNFPLLGKHRSVPCGDCHRDGVIAGTPSSCEACHWDRRRDDPYRGQLGIHCGECHTPFDWKLVKPGSWEHGLATGFPLSGAHRTMDCTACHPDNTFKGRSQECYSCHRSQYEGAPNHVSANYPTDCRQCHFSETSWQGGQTGHASFPLQGQHAAAACADCHKNNVYAGTPRDCSGCHMPEYDATRDPDHRLAGYSTDCASCHGSAAVTWNDATLNHDLYWPLLGAHKLLQCDLCHAAGYDLPRDCYGCHQADYERTTTPNHRQAGYSTACQDCHLTSHTSWEQAVFNHKFPIESGDHSGFACSDCHLNSNYLVFSCIDCHAHTKSEMDDTHDDVGGYSYNSLACYTCHPSGREILSSGSRRR